MVIDDGFRLPQCKVIFYCSRQVRTVLRRVSDLVMNDNPYKFLSILSAKKMLGERLAPFVRFDRIFIQLYCRSPDSDLQKLLQIFIANKSTNLHLQFPLIVEFDLINKPMDLTRPAFDAVLDVVMLPTNESDTLDLMDAAKNQELQDAEFEGMIQLWNTPPFARE